MKKETVTTEFTIKGKDKDGKPTGKDTERKVTTPAGFPETLAEASKWAGEDVVLNRAVAKFRIDFQSEVRRLAISGKTDAEIATAMASWKPKAAAPRGDGMAAIQKKLAQLSPEQRKMLLTAQ